jgi:transposase
MREQLRRAGTPSPPVIGIDEVSIRRAHTYPLVVSDLIRQRPIWFGGTDRSEASLDQFYAWLGPRKAARVRLAVMDMWKLFRLSTARHAPQASILFDKFHVLRATWARLSIRSARASTRASRGASGASPRGARI